MKPQIYLPLSVKIYAISLLMLSFVLVVAIGNYMRMTLIKEEVRDVAEYISPINKQITDIYIHTLEQEVLFERVLRLFRQRPQTQSVMAAQQQALARRQQQMQQQIQATQTLAEQATYAARIHQDAIALARIYPDLRMLAEDQTQMHSLYHEVFEAVEKGDETRAQLLTEQLQRQEAQFNNRISRLQHELFGVTQAGVDKIQQQDESLLSFNLGISAAALIVGILLAGYASRRVTAPLKALIKGSDELLNENYKHQLPVYSHDEIGELTHSFNQLMHQVEQKEVLRASMQEYLDPRVVKLLTEHPEEAKGSRHQASVLFSDIAQFSKLSETLSPESLVAVINEYYNLAGKAILDIDGVVDKYIGDAIVAFWSPPFTESDSCARLACRGALKHMEQLHHLRLSLPAIVGIRKGLPDIDIRIGIATGEIIVGNIGTRQNRSFTIIGSAVNLAEQLEQLNKKLKTHILVTENTMLQAGSEFLFRLAATIEQVQSDKQNNQQKIYQLLGYKDAFSEVDINRFRHCDTLLQNFFQAQDVNTINALKNYTELNPEDSVAQFHWQSVAP